MKLTPEKMFAAAVVIAATHAPTNVRIENAGVMNDAYSPMLNCETARVTASADADADAAAAAAQN